LGLTSQAASPCFSAVWTEREAKLLLGTAPDKPTVFSVYQAFIGRAKPTDWERENSMKEMRFEGWAQVLAQSQLPEKQKQSWEITLRWYLSFCRLVWLSRLRRASPRQGVES
jgi:hypothetical protein